MTGSTLLFENRKNNNSPKRKKFKEQIKLRKNKYFHIIVSYTNLTLGITPKYSP